MHTQSAANLLLLGLLVSSGVVSAAPSFKITGSVPAHVQLNAVPQTNARSIHATSSPKVLKAISLEKVELSPAAAAFLANSADKPSTTNSLVARSASALPPSALLGMNNVPVLDQGQHGTCVTFADTAALDAIHGKTDYISQLCNLDLGLYLEAENKKNGIEYPSGWDGSMNEIVLGQIQKYGIVTMSYQNQYGCGSAAKVLKAYPLNDENNTGSPMSAADFSSHSEGIMKDIYWQTLLSGDDAFTPNAKMDMVLNKVKASIANGHRVVFGTLVDVNGDLQDVMGAAGSFHDVANDSWIVTKKIKKDLKAQLVRAGHAMVITGYDDDAVITGPDGERHQGVLYLRNSWSKRAGEHGDYYMSYDYFKLMVMETQEVSPTPLA